MLHHDRIRLALAALAALTLLFGCPAGDDDDSAGDDDDVTGDDDDDSADDDDATADDDDDATADDDDDSTADDDDDDSTPSTLSTSLDVGECSGQGGGPIPAMLLEDLGGGDLRVLLSAWELNCCLEMVVVQAVLVGPMIRVVVEDQGEPCDCLCDFNVDITVHGVPAGSYGVELYWSGGGSALVAGQVEIGP